MIRTKINLIFILLLAFVLGANSQEPPKAVLVDEFGVIGCEDLSGRLDNFLNLLLQKPDSFGYVVLSSNPEHKRAIDEEFIDGYARFRKFDEKRFILVKASLEKLSRIQLWLVPPGAQLSFHPEVESGYKLRKSFKKELLYSNFGEYGPCYTGAPLRLASKYLKVDSDLHANVAIGSRSAKGFEKVKNEVMRLFQNDYSVEPSRLRFFWHRIKSEPNIREVWLIRKKTN